MRGTLLLVVLIAVAATLPIAGDPSGPVCPQCSAPLDPGAKFCTQCGRKLDAPAPAADGLSRPAGPPPSGIVRLVATHDKELVSTYVAVVYGQTIRVDSILGSAFAIAPGEFLSDAGLLSGASGVSLVAGDGRSAAARVVGLDPLIGVALLVADLPSAKPLTLRSDAPRVGEPIRAFGLPSGLRTSREVTESPGVVGALNRGNFGIHPIEDYFQTDASLPDGFAGGPVLDESGRVLGMTTALVSGRTVRLGLGEGIRAAIPSRWIERALRWIRDGQPARPWVGAYTIAADAEARSFYGLPADITRIVEQIFPGSPAAAAGLKPGDGLLRLDGLAADRLLPLQERLLGARPGETVRLEVLRAGGERTSVEVVLSPRPERPRLSAIDTLRYYGGLTLEPRTGGSLVVARVLPGSEAASARLKSGDLLQSVLGKKDLDHVERYNVRWRSVKSIADLEERIAAAYSDLDFFVGLRFRSPDAKDRYLLLWSELLPSRAL